MTARKLILDVDTGSDDAIAVMMAALAPGLDLVGCTTVWGNHDVETTTANTLSVLSHVDRDDVPVYRGLAKPFAPIPFRFADHVDSERAHVHPEHFPVPPSSRAAARKNAVEWLVETLRATTERLTLVPVAPLTNIAAAVTVDPSIVDAVDEIVIMGGAHALGNVTSVAEANIWHDPAAAAVVLAAGFERLVLVPLDATHRALVTSADVERLAAADQPHAHSAATLLRARIAGYTLTQPQAVLAAAPVHDALCVAYLLDPRVVDLVPCHVAVETTGYAGFGATLIDVASRSRLPTNAHVALSADARLFTELLTDTLGRSSGRPGRARIAARDQPHLSRS